MKSLNASALIFFIGLFAGYVIATSSATQLRAEARHCLQGSATNAYWDAIFEGDLRKIEKLISENSALPCFVPGKRTLVSVAAFQGQLGILKLLHAKGIRQANPDALSAAFSGFSSRSQDVDDNSELEKQFLNYSKVYALLRKMKFKPNFDKEIGNEFWLSNVIHLCDSKRFPTLGPHVVRRYFEMFGLSAKGVSEKALSNIKQMKTLVQINLLNKTCVEAALISVFGRDHKL